MKIRTVLVAMISLGLVGCTPVVSQSLRREADRSLSFAALQANPQKWQGETVILGGEVLAVFPANGGSWLWVQQKELDAQLRPVDQPEYGGQFWVSSSRFLPDYDYVRGRKVTVAGTVSGQKDNAPLISARELHLWEHPFELHTVPPDWFQPPYLHWYIPPYFDPYMHSF